jgi:hypothetical protein
MKSLLVLVPLLAACVGEVPVTATSQSYLTPSGSRAMMREAPDAAARDVVRLFGERGDTLVDQHVNGNDRMLTFRGTRAVVFRYVLGSEFVATLRAVPGGGTELDLVGRPLENGTQPVIPADIAVEDTRVSGAEEAQVVHGVLAELVVDGMVVPTADTASLPAGAPTEVEQCKAARIAALRRAAAITDPDDRAAAFEAAPDCTRLEAGIPAT